MKKLAVFFYVMTGLLVVCAIALAVLFLTSKPEPFEDGTVSAERIQPGPWAVGKQAETFVDSTRPTQPNGDYPGSDQRVLVGDVWYPDAAEATDLPLLIYSHGFTSTRANGRYLAEHLASHGFVVAAVDYPLTVYSAPGGPRVDDVVFQPGDISHLIDSLLATSQSEDHPLFRKIDGDSIGVLGVSLGGLTSTLVGFHPRWRDDRIDAVMSIAGPSAFLTPRFFGHADPTFLMLAGTLDVLVPYATNAAPIPTKTPDATLVSIAGGSHTGFSGGTRWLRWLDNPDRLGCYAVTSNIEADEPDTWRDLLGTTEEGIDNAVENEICQVQPLPRAINPVRQQMMTSVVARAFFEQVLTPGKRSVQAATFLLTQLASELEEVTVSAP